MTAFAAPRVLAVLVGICLALFGVSMIFGGVFPMPDPRHGGFGLGLAIHFVPFLLAAALWKQPTLRGFNLFLVANGLAMVVLFAIIMGVGTLVTRGNVGIFQRVYALTMFLWIGVAAAQLLHRPPMGAVG